MLDIEGVFDRVRFSTITEVIRGINPSIMTMLGVRRLRIESSNSFSYSSLSTGTGVVTSHMVPSGKSHLVTTKSLDVPTILF